MDENNIRELSPLDKDFKRIAERIERQSFSVPQQKFEDETEETKNKRIKRAMKDFFYFDRVYFPESVHTQGYYKPGVLHYSILAKSQETGVHWFGAFRDLAKTAYLKKLRIWFLLTGRASIGGIMSETLNKSSKFIRSIETVLIENQLLQRDFDIKIEIMNEHILRFTSKINRRHCYYLAYSLDSNPRGDNVNIERPDFIDFDDLETYKNNHNEENTQKRLKKILEAYRSCKENANMIGLGNNIHPKCLFNRLKILQEKGEKSEVITVYPYPAWSKERTEYTPYLGSVWQNKFNAQSEAEMKAMMKVHDDVEWSEAMCDPVLKTGHIFPREFLRTYKKANLPADAVGPSYCDPNLSMKGKGDTTALGALLYSRSNDAYYVHGARCKSYSDSNQLLQDYIALFGHRVRIMGMDGNVAQESSWINNVRNFTRSTGRPFPPLKFCRYNVDMMATHFEQIYKQGKVYFEEEFIGTEEGQEAMEQFHSFISKKEKKKDDFPDFLVCCYALGLEYNMFIPVAVSGANLYEVQQINLGSYF